MVVNPSKSVPVESCQPRHSHTNQPALAVISAVFYKNCEFRHFVQQRSDIGECNGRKHYWRELPQVSFLSRQKICRDNHVFFATKHVFCRDKSMLVATKLFSRKTRVCFVATKMILGAAPASDKEVPACYLFSSLCCSPRPSCWLGCKIRPGTSVPSAGA